MSLRSFQKKTEYFFSTRAELSLYFPKSLSVYYLCEQHSKTTEISNLLTIEDQKIIPDVISLFPKENGIFFFQSRIIVIFQSRYQYLCEQHSKTIEISRSRIEISNLFKVEDQKIVRPFQKNILYPDKSRMISKSFSILSLRATFKNHRNF